MNKTLSTLLLIIFCLGFISSTHYSCKKTDEPALEPVLLTVSLPRHKLLHNLYYSLDYDERSIELEFNEAIEENSVMGNIIFEDRDGLLNSDYDLAVSGRKVMLMFRSGFQLRGGWKYLLTIKSGLRSTLGTGFRNYKVIEFRTLALHVGKMPDGGINTDSLKRNSIACISDIHMGDARAASDGYCWFGKNATALTDFLDMVMAGNQVRQLVILGDLFDEWLIPYTIPPFDDGVVSSEEYFESVASNPVNAPIIEKLKAIALEPDIDLVYVHGNHDMLLTKETLEGIIPNIIWAGDVNGLGKYSPIENMIMEHGHRYDFFNCPQPLVNDGHILPPGYFVSRLYAQGLMDQTSNLQKELWEYHGSFEFLAAWEVAQLYTLLHFDMQVPDLSAENILMSGIDDYNDPFSFDGARDMYAANIEDSWDATQTQNDVPVHINCCLQSIWNGHSDLFSAAQVEFLESTSPKAYKVVAFGHTHEPMVKVYPESGDYTGIYANSGSWINSEESGYHVRTYLLITPAQWTGSDLDMVSLYQYNLDSENGNQVYKPVLLAEESIEVSE